MTSRPDRTTMQGMMWNANHVLDSALDPKTNGVPRKFFETCVGLILISVVEVGFVFTGNVGTGILMAKTDDGSWSAPSAIGLTGVGWGFIAGASLKDVMVFIFDRNTLEAVAGDTGLKFGGQGEITFGPFGRTAEASINISNKGAGGTVSVSFTKGFFGGISLEGAAMCPRTAVNQTYYASHATPTQILFENAVQVNPDSLMPEIYKKLTMLAKGGTSEGTDTAQKEKVENANANANAPLETKAPEEKDLLSEPDIHVNIAEEIAKE